MCCVIYRKDHITEGLYFEMSHCVENHWPTERLWAYPRHAVLSTTQLNTMISPEGWEGQGVGRNLAVKGISTQATSLQSPRFSNSFFAIPKTSLVLFSHRVPSDTNLVLTGSNLYKPGCTPLLICKTSNINMLTSPLQNLPHSTVSTCCLCCTAVVGHSWFSETYCICRCFVQCYRATCVIIVLVLWS